MPIRFITLKGIEGYRYGNQKFYPIKKYGKSGAREKARKQGQAITLSKLRRNIKVKASRRARGYERGV